MTDPFVYTLLALATTLLTGFGGLWFIGFFDRGDKSRHHPAE